VCMQRYTVNNSVARVLFPDTLGGNTNAKVNEVA